MATFRGFRARVYAGRSAHWGWGEEEGGDSRLWLRPPRGGRRKGRRSGAGLSSGRGAHGGGRRDLRAVAPPPGRRRAGRRRCRRRGSRRGARLASQAAAVFRSWVPRGGPGQRPRFGGHLARARPPRREEEQRQAGNCCVAAARRLLRSVSAARSGSRRGPRGGGCGRPRPRRLAGGWRVAGLAWSLGASRGRVATALGAAAAAVCVWGGPRLPHPPSASRSAGCPERGSGGEIPGFPGVAAGVPVAPCSILAKGPVCHPASSALYRCES